ncbi:MAG: hypothetical protein U9O82_08305 [Thermodesulfobacteriota bacterium]|nr:hypothetical protein [Thermodesulfobacteriota bacterium]
MSHTPQKQYYPAPATYYYPARVNPAYVQPSAALTTGMFGMVVGGTAAMGVNLHRMQDNKMTLGQAMTDSFAKGAAVGVATAAGVTAARAVGSSGLTSLVVLLATATGVGYMINTVSKPAEKSSSSIKSE